MVMTKIGLITIVNGMSFGNRLQNYATQCVFEKLGYEIETINNRFEKGTPFKCKVLHTAARIMKLLKINETRRVLWERAYRFYRWDKKYIKYSKAHCDASNPRSFKKIKKYNYYVVGSDQIWNPLYAANRGFELLSFAEPSKRVALSTSIGTEKLPPDLTDLYMSELGQFKAISVREEKAAELVSHLTGKTVEVLIDPTLVLTRDDWADFEKRPQLLLPQEYVLKFFLTAPDEDATEMMTAFAKEKHLPIIELGVGLPGYEKIGPNEFIYLISHAKMIFTDSFHCTVFSMIFSKNVVVYDRFDHSGMESRLITLLNLVERPYCWMGLSGDRNKINQIFMEEPYDIEPAIQRARNSFIQFIKAHCV